MTTLILYPKNPLRAWIWTRKDYCGDMGFRRGVGDKIKPRVSQDGRTEYYLGNEWLQEGAVIVEERSGRLAVYPMEEIKKRYEIERAAVCCEQTGER